MFRHRIGLAKTHCPQGLRSSTWLPYLQTRLTNAAIEAVNSLLQMAKRIARGFRNFHYFRIAAYLKASRLNLQIPHPLPT
jgi:hypothetical protein